MTGLKKTAQEVGAMDAPEVFELLDYWLDFPPEHLLIRAQIGYEGRKGSRKSNWTRRRERAAEMQDEVYKPEAEETNEAARELMNVTRGARHLDCAPGHIQKGIELLKKNLHMEVPGAPE